MPDGKQSPQLYSARNPVQDQFHREIESMISRFFGSPSPFFPMPTAAQRTGLPSLDMTGVVSPAIDVHETDAAIELTAELPGLSDDDVEIELRNRQLTLRGEKAVAHDGGGDLHVNERSYGSFTRTMTLPDTVDPEKITAEFKKGVLHITMPKTEPQDPGRKIKVSSK